MSCIPTLFTYIFNPFSVVFVFNFNKKEKKGEEIPLLENNKNSRYN